MSSHIANINPLRYRGYYYDTEYNLYYLQTRYYDPAIGRFLNGDAYASTGTGFLGHNMYAYCENNPVVFIDSSGNKKVSIRAFVESRGGKAEWDPKSRLALFVLNDKFIITHASGRNLYGMNIYNNNGRMTTDDYILAYYFGISNWVVYLPDFKWYSGRKDEEGVEGFEVLTIDLFNSKSFCWDFAGTIIKLKGKNGKYLGEDQFGIAAECYAHARIKNYSALTLQLFNRGHSHAKSAKHIGYVANDPNSAYFKVIWFLGI